MAFDLHLSIPEESPAGRVLRRIVEAQKVTPEQAVQKVLEEAGEQTPAERLVGAFSSPEDSAILERAMQSAKAHREQFDHIRNLG